jgi:UTP--glucose-1-phosphate uridylyltransferase|tara:strand:+ start:1027 stop:1857 length:831 start_codon:yes stop_codon:yes gene_type:complete
MINKCLFPVAGYGSRFLPATKAIPKEMLPILTKPLLQYGVEEAISAGIKNMAIVTGRGKRSIEDHFDHSFELESQLKGTSKEHFLQEINKVIEKTTFSYIRQRKMLGLGHAILTGEPLIGHEPFAVVLADDLCTQENNGVISQLVDVYKKYQCSIIAIAEVPKSQISQYGIVSGKLIEGTDDTYLVSDMVEKPRPSDAPSNLAIIGRYILTPSIFDIIRNTKPGKLGEIQITDALLVQAKKEKVIAYKFKGSRFDCGSINGYLEATNHFARLQGII